MEIRIQNCRDCGAKPGETHMPGCDVEVCSVCGGQKLVCSCEEHDPFFARWTGLWPGVAECMALGMYAKWPGKDGKWPGKDGKWPGKDGKWEKCDSNDPAGGPDLNNFYAMGYNRIFFIKPKEDRGTIRYEEKVKNKS